MDRTLLRRRLQPCGLVIWITKCGGGGAPPILLSLSTWETIGRDKESGSEWSWRGWIAAAAEDVMKYIIHPVRVAGKESRFTVGSCISSRCAAGYARRRPSPPHLLPPTTPLLLPRAPDLDNPRPLPVVAAAGIRRGVQPVAPRIGCSCLRTNGHGRLLRAARMGVPDAGAACCYPNGDDDCWCC